MKGETKEEFSTRLAANLENLILKEGPEIIAAFIAEPVMSAGGVIPPPATYFEKIQAVVMKYDILFIAEEVICAFGRLGHMYGCDKYNIKPDLVSVAKIDVAETEEESEVTAETVIVSDSRSIGVLCEDETVTDQTQCGVEEKLEDSTPVKETLDADAPEEETKDCAAIVPEADSESLDELVKEEKPEEKELKASEYDQNTASLLVTEGVFGIPVILTPSNS